MNIIGNKKYPANVDGVLAKPALAKLFRAHVKSELSQEVLDFYEAPYNPEKMYWQFLRRDAPQVLNVGYALFDDADDLKGKWDDPEWSTVIKLARNETYKMLQFDILGRFYKSEAFKTYHAAQGGTEHKAGDPIADDEPDRMPPKIIQAAKRLGVKDPESLRLYVGALDKYGIAQAEKVGKKLLRDEGLTIKLTVLNQFLIEAKIAKPAKTAQPEPLGAATLQVKLNKKVLQVCGFQNLRGDKPLGRIREMILALLGKDKRSAEMIFAKILKDEPKDSLLHGDKLVDLIKRMKKRKAFELVR